MLAHLRRAGGTVQPDRIDPQGSSAVSAAPISEPSSMVPVVSTVTLTRMGTRLPISPIAT